MRERKGCVGLMEGCVAVCERVYESPMCVCVRAYVCEKDNVCVRGCV